jgi:uncharacterized membrane protein
MFELAGFVRDRSGDITFFSVPGANGPGPNAHAVSINNRGDVAGYFAQFNLDTGSRRLRGFVRTGNGGIRVFDATPNALETKSAGINELGDIVGNYTDASGTHNFLKRWNGAITLFDVGGLCTAINDRGDVIAINGVLRNGNAVTVGLLRSAR